MRVNQWVLIVMCTGLMALPGCKGDGGGGGTDSGPTEMDLGPVDAGPRCTSNTDCDDGLFCNGAETCGADGVCVAGQALDCDDGIACTDDRCAEQIQGCINEAPDADGDGHRDGSCLDDMNQPLGDDCDDQDNNRFPGNIEVCDMGNHDEDCNETTFGFEDVDGDSFPAARCCNPAFQSNPGGPDICGSDCDDVRPQIRPGATEACDRLDNDCNGNIDEGVAIPGFIDADFDGAGGGVPMTECAGRPGFSATSGDCDDGDPSIYPGAAELCDGRNNDCDAMIDEAAESVNWYPDTDGDGFGDPMGPVINSCNIQVGYSLLDTDCNDGNGAINPAAAELCDGLDNDCDGEANFEIGVNDFEDDDGDGIVDIQCPIVGVDCDDFDPLTGGGAAEACDGRDNDCDMRVDEGAEERQWFADNDMDGFGSIVSGSVISCQPQPGFIAQAGDCDDGDMFRNPSVMETCNGRDDDCDGAADESPSTDSCVGMNVNQWGCFLGRCEPLECAPGFLDCDGDATPGCETPYDPSNCGECGRSCMGPGVDTATCDMFGQCNITSCVGGALNCDMNPDNGCEVDPFNDDQHCGGCTGGGGGEVCGPSMSGITTCEGGQCRVTYCDPNFADCNLTGSDGCERNLLMDDMNCGACGRVCAEDPGRRLVFAFMGQGCQNGDCQLICESGYEDCNGDRSGRDGDGCESDINMDPNNCGFCGLDCQQLPNVDTGMTFCDTATCQIACQPGWADCDMDPMNGCEVNTDDDIGNCGGCMGMGGSVCTPGPMGEPPVCNAGMCSVECSGDTADCDSMVPGCETNLREDDNNCGTCGFMCMPGTNATGAICHDGQCENQCQFGFADCDPMVDGCELNVDADPFNCGGCGIDCGQGGTCSFGFCDRVTQVAVANGTTCALRDSGAIVCWGDRGDGATGYEEMGGGRIDPPAAPPVDLSGMTVRYTQIAAGSRHFCAIDQFGGVSCWGDNGSRQCGNALGSSEAPFNVPVPGQAVQLALGAFHSCALMTDGQVFCWGDNMSGQLGRGTQTVPTETVQPVINTMMMNLDKVVQITATFTETCAMTDTDVQCWGAGAFGLATSATTVVGTENWNDMLSLRGSNADICVLRQGAGGSIYCWGQNSSGVIGSPPMTAIMTPQVVPGINSPQEIFMGRDSLCARTPTGIYCRGDNSSGRLGTIGGSITQDLWLPVPGTAGYVGLAVGGGLASSQCAFDNNVNVRCWGDNTNGEIGIGSMLTLVTAPTEVVGLNPTMPMDP